MKHIICLLLSLALCFALFACGQTAPEPATAITTEAETTVEIEVTTEDELTTEAEITLSAPVTAGKYHHYTNENDGSDYYIWLPNSMSIEGSIIMDMEFAGFPNSPNSPPDPPRKVGEFCGIYELAPGKNLEDIAGTNYQNTEENTWEHLDAGEFTGQTGNRIYYQAVTGGELGSLRYHFYIMLDDTRVAQLYLWNSEYTPEVDLPRFSEIAASVKL